MYKKRFLRLISAVLALSMMAALLPTAAFAADPEPTPTPASSFTFSYDDDTQTASVTGFMGSETEIVIPGTVELDGKMYIVTSIGARALQKCSATSIRIPASVETIERNAIYWCNSLETVTFEENSQLTSIGWMAFYYNKALKSVEIPVGVTSIGDSAFGECDSLTGVKIPSSVTTIGEKAFSQCFALNEITIPSSVTSIGEDAFRLCKGLKSVQFEENSKLTSIPDGMFEICSNLVSVKLPSSITSIGEWAFSECELLSSIVIPESVTSIGNWAFSKCSALESVEFGKNSRLVSIGESAFLNCGSLESIEIPDSVANIGMFAFGMCKKLTNVDFGENSRLADIAQSTFFECEKLAGVELPSSIMSIGLSAFSYSGLTSIEIPDGVTTIGKGAFRNCDALQTVTIPAGVTSVASDIFEYSQTPKTIYFKGTEEEWENLKFDPTGTDSPEITISYLRTVEFDSNGHGIAPADEIIVENGKTIPADKKPADPTETGYTFKGWYYTENGVEKEFVFGDNGTPVTSSMTLTAKWVEKATLTAADLQLNRETQKMETATGVEGAGDITTQWYAVDENDQPTGEPLATLEGAKAGMYQAEAVIAEGDNYKAATLTDTGWRIFVAAKLEPSKPIFYDITVKNGTTNLASAKKGELVKLFANDPAEGEEFDYWQVNGEKIEGDSFEMPAAAVTAVAVYKAKTYSVVFVTAHDTAPNSLTVKHGETISGDRILKADGYEFGGWYNGNEKFVFGENGTKVTSNLTLTAKWTEVKKPDPTPEPEPDPEPVVYEIVINNGTAYLEDGETAINKAEESQMVMIKGHY